ncbi:MAG TPA: glycosyltransferase, partial [Pseudoxanthomonas sp.]|nr:glycosyltransferase [Pseudoxanthomonas sp.]
LPLELLLPAGAMETAGFWQGFRTSPVASIEAGVAAADIVVLPAWVEHQPRGLLRAIAMGKPVIATPTCGLPDTLPWHLLPRAMWMGFATGSPHCHHLYPIEPFLTEFHMSQPPSLPPLPLPVLPAPVARRRMPVWGWVLLASGLLVVGLVIGLVGWAVSWGWGMFEEQARVALQADPVVQAHIGQIREMELELVATGNAKGSDEFVFKLEGSRGNGMVIAEFSSTVDSEGIRDGELTMADGTRYALQAVDGSAD